MKNTTQPDLFSWAPPLTDTAPPVEASDGTRFEFLGLDLEPQPDAVIPEWLRLPWEDGFVELGWGERVGKR